MRLRPARLLLVAAVALLACGGSGDVAPDLPDPAVLPVPDPDLGQLEPSLRQWLLQAREQMTAMARRPDADPRQVGQAFGELGQLFHSYELRDAAQVCYGNAAALLPGEHKWPYLSALIDQHLGNLEQAASGLERSLELQPDLVPALIRLGDVYLERNQPEVARQRFERALELDPGSAAAVFGLGRVEAAVGNSAAAARRFERALELQPAASSVHYPLAQAYRRLGRLGEARRHLERQGRQEVTFPDPLSRELTDIRNLTSFRVIQTLAADSGEVTPEELLGFTLTQIGRLNGTVEALERAIADRELRADATDRRELAVLHYLTAGVLVFRDRDPDAITHLRTAVELDPGLVDARVKLGNALARSGDLETAIDQYSRALELRPGDTEIVLKRSTALINRGQPRRAVEDLERLLAARPLDPVVQVRLAEVLEASGEIDRARERLEAATRLQTTDGDLARIHRGFGDFWRRRGELERAAEEYAKAVELDRTFNSARLELAAVLGRLGRYGEAAREYARVVTDRPQDEAARIGECTALILDRRYGEARERLEEGVAAVSGSSALAHLLARLLAAAPEPALRDGARALELALRAFEREPRPEYAETVAMAYAEIGRFAEASEWQGRAVARAPSPSARARFELYRSQRPFAARAPEDLLVAPSSGSSSG